MAQIHQGDIGTVIKVNVGTDLTNATVTKIRVLKTGDTTSTEWTATVDDALNGIIAYTATTGDFSVAGVYRLQSYVEFNTGEKLSGEAVEFQVHDKLA